MIHENSHNQTMAQNDPRNYRTVESPWMLTRPRSRPEGQESEIAYRRPLDEKEEIRKNIRKQSQWFSLSKPMKMNQMLKLPQLALLVSRSNGRSRSSLRSRSMQRSASGDLKYPHHPGQTPSTAPSTVPLKCRSSNGTMRRRNQLRPAN